MKSYVTDLFAQFVTLNFSSYNKSTISVWESAVSDFCMFFPRISRGYLYPPDPLHLRLFWLTWSLNQNQSIVVTNQADQDQAVAYSS